MKHTRAIAAALAVAVSATALGQGVPRQSPGGTVTFRVYVYGPGSRIVGAGDVVGYYPERGCYVVQLRGWQSPVVACAGETPVVGIGRPVRVVGVITRTVRQRQGPFLDVVPLIEGRVEPLRRQPRGRGKV